MIDVAARDQVELSGAFAAGHTLRCWEVTVNYNV
jgi:hypothetical protein